MEVHTYRASWDGMTMDKILDPKGCSYWYIVCYEAY